MKPIVTPIRLPSTADLQSQSGAVNTKSSPAAALPVSKPGLLLAFQNRRAVCSFLHLLLLALCTALGSASAQTIYTVGADNTFGSFDLTTRQYTQISANLGGGNTFNLAPTGNGAFYATQNSDGTGNTNDTFVKISTAGVTTQIGASHGVGELLLSLARRASDGTLYAYGTNSAATGTVNPTTGVFTPIGSAGNSSSGFGGGFAFIGSTLYSASISNNGSLHTVNTSTGAFSAQIGASNNNYEFAVLFGAGGNLYLLSGKNLYLVNTTSGVLTLQGAVTGTGTPSAFYGAAVVDDSQPVITSSLTANATQGQNFSYQITATNGPINSYGASPLPTALSINTQTGVITGKPTVDPGTYSVTLTAQNASDTGSATLQLTVASGAPIITSATTANATQGQDFSYQIIADNTPTRFAADNLPDGLSINTTSGQITGSPTGHDTFSITLRAINVYGTGTKTLTLAVAGAAPVITSADTASGAQGQPFSYQITATNGPIIDYMAANLPSTLSVNSSGLISGTPTGPGSYSVGLMATNDTATGTKTLTLTVAAGTPTANSQSVSVAFKTPTAVTLSGSDPDSPALNLTYAIVTPPTHGTLSPGTAPDQFTYTPSSGYQGSDSFTFTVSNGTNTSRPATVSLSVAQGYPLITSAGSDSATQGQAYSYQITTSYPATTYAASPLPAGLSLNPASGTISGVPRAAGVFQITLSASNTNGTNTRTLTLSVAGAPPVITSAANASGRVGQSVSYLVTATNSPTSYGVSSGTLPPGLSLDGSSGLISGVPIQAGSFQATLSASNATGQGMLRVDFLIAAPPAPQITNGNLNPPARVGVAFAYQIQASNSPTSYSASGLPPGLMLNGASGKISGTPTTPGTYSVGLTASNQGGQGTATLSLLVKAQPPVITSAQEVTAIRQGVAFGYSITATNSPTNYGVGGARLPEGLSINQFTGRISGTPQVSGTFTYTIAAFNNGGSGSAPLKLVIAPSGPVITSPTSATATVGQPFRYQITAKYNPTSFGASGLPAGLVFDRSTGLISGTPTQAGSAAVTVAAFNSVTSDSQKVALTIK